MLTVRNINNQEPEVIVCNSRFGNKTIFCYNVSPNNGDDIAYKIASLKAEGRQNIRLITYQDYLDLQKRESTAEMRAVTVNIVTAEKFNQTFCANEPCRWMCGVDLEIFHTKFPKSGLYDFYVRVGKHPEDIAYFLITAPIETTYPELKRLALLKMKKISEMTPV